MHLNTMITSSAGAPELSVTSKSSRKLTSGETYWVNSNGDHYTIKFWLGAFPQNIYVYFLTVKVIKP